MLEYTRSTDATHEIKLDSAITNAVWGHKQASAGDEVPVIVYTHFVGSGSEIRITIRSKSGRRLDRIDGKVYGDRFRKTYTVSENAKEAIYFEAELRKHGLKEKSEEMTIVPPITITNVRWSKQEAGRGEILKLTADVDGVSDGTEARIEIYEHDADGAHDFITKLPVLVENKKVETEWAFEYHEDTDDIPTEEESERGYNPPEYFFKVIIYGQKGESKLLEFKDWVEFDFLVDEENYESGVQAVFTYPDGQQQTKEIPRDGKIRFDDVPPGQYRLEVDEYDIVIEGEN